MEVQLLAAASNGVQVRAGTAELDYVHMLNRVLPDDVRVMGWLPAPRHGPLKIHPARGNAAFASGENAAAAAALVGAKSGVGTTAEDSDRSGHAVHVGLQWL